jgi:hypothetical protein
VGLIRKGMSLSTMGLVSYRDKEERAAKYAKQTRNAARAQVAQQAMMLEHQRQQINQMDHANVREEVRDQRAFYGTPAPQSPPAGWYADPQDGRQTRWFDGHNWTEFTQPRV